MNENADRILAAIEQVQQDLGGLRYSYERLQLGYERLQLGYERLQQDCERLQHNYDRLEQGQDRLRVDLMARMDRMQNEITGIRDDITVNFGASDQVRRVHDNTREELRGLSELVSTMARQIQRLQTDVRHLKGEP